MSSRRGCRRRRAGW
uniref:Uncharacterized protein n=1 Tax=Arundo donax TaxID=35708 RepID=A0A0A8ZY57_ARUDO